MTTVGELMVVAVMVPTPSEEDQGRVAVVLLWPTDLPSV